MSSGKVLGLLASASSSACQTCCLGSSSLRLPLRSASRTSLSEGAFRDGGVGTPGISPSSRSMLSTILRERRYSKPSSTYLPVSSSRRPTMWTWLWSVSLCLTTTQGEPA
jgi:hypothetical protein